MRLLRKKKKESRENLFDTEKNKNDSALFLEKKEKKQKKLGKEKREKTVSNRKLKKEQKEREKFEAYQRKMKRENEKKRFVREWREQLRKLSESYYKEMLIVYKETQAIIKWIDAYSSLFHAMKETYVHFDEAFKELLGEIPKLLKRKEISNLLKTSFHSYVQKIESIEEAYDTAFSASFMTELNRFENSLQEVHKEFFKPSPLHESRIEKIEERFNKFMEKAEFIQDVKVELESFLKRLERGFGELKGFSKKILSIIKKIENETRLKELLHDNDSYLYLVQIEKESSLSKMLEKQDSSLSPEALEKSLNLQLASLSEEREQMIKERSRILSHYEIAQMQKGLRKEEVHEISERPSPVHKKEIKKEILPLKAFSLPRLQIHSKKYPLYSSRTGRVIKN